MYNVDRAKSKSYIKPQPGDLIIVNASNKSINAYCASKDFSFANVAFAAVNGELGVILNNIASENESILYHYVCVLFERGLIGIVHGGLITVLAQHNLQDCS